MNVHEISTSTPPELAQALRRFEEQFRYPLGPGRTFRIDHGEDYPSFFRAMGEGVCFVAERGGSILGVLGAALRSLAIPGGEQRRVVYIGDLKITPSARGGRVLLRLAEAVRQWVGDRTTAAYAVVMNGTPITPLHYSGRLGIPLFAELGKIMILRVPTSTFSIDPAGTWLTTAEQGGDCYLDLSAGRYACPGDYLAERSEMEPIWLVEPRGRACGRLEDTRKAKRLIDDDGNEMRSAHLSCFAFQDLAASIELLRVALDYAAHRGVPALFLAIAAPEANDFCRALAGMGAVAVAAPATIYGTGLAAGPLWNINTTEI